MDPTYYTQFYSNSCLNGITDLKATTAVVPDSDATMTNSVSNVGGLELFSSTTGGLSQMNPAAYSPFLPTTSTFDWRVADQQHRLLMLNAAQQNICRNEFPRQSVSVDSFPQVSAAGQNSAMMNFAASNPTAITMPTDDANFLNGFNKNSFSTNAQWNGCFADSLSIGYAAAAYGTDADTNGVLNAGAYNLGDFSLEMSCYGMPANIANGTLMSNANGATDSGMESKLVAIFEHFSTNANSAGFCPSGASDLNSTGSSNSTDSRYKRPSSGTKSRSTSSALKNNSAASAPTNSKSTKKTKPSNLSADTLSSVSSTSAASSEPTKAPALDLFNAMNATIPTYPTALLNSSAANGLGTLLPPACAFDGRSDGVTADSKDFSLAMAAAQFSAYQRGSAGAINMNGNNDFSISNGHNAFGMPGGEALRILSQRRPNPPYKYGPGSNNVRVRTSDKYRSVYSDQQRLELEKEYDFSQFITSERKAHLSLKLQLTERQIKIWFQNRRAKKRKEEKNQPFH